MAQIANGIRSVLSLPIVYNSFSNLLGAKKARRFFVDNYISPADNAKILDIGCGTGEMLQFLPNTVQYFGFDLSNDYINYAKKKYGPRGDWHCSAVSDMEVGHSGTFDVVMALGILHHLDDSEALQLCNLAASALKPTGYFCTIDGCYVDGQNPIARYLISKDRGLNVRSPDGYKSIVSQYFNDVKMTILHDLLRVPYTQAIMVARKPEHSTAR